ncbi:hypothetical protein ALI144C_15470 [Actinosynnema sp. ALI-1.44]|uniref:(2Fe-2S)-binding protein n=1 Tax=Actinosynnema sp. ALI-1.44 TaxID=1933779 RepID=UPI00097C73FF|nr:(2Fe-2S)-binding protein [Actinosynnema sp. ALI-1.44]ONI84099.1 hypothetical protein ALI144C_15470 [Actinosynnema sp. ALI-1.44]
MNPVTDNEVTRALAHVTTLGGMFTIQPEHQTGGGLLGAECADHAAIGARLAAVGASYGTDEVRVAASMLQYELSARLLAVLVGTWSHHRIVVDPAGFTVGADRGAWQLAAARHRAWRATDVPASRIVHLVAGRLEVLHRTIRSHTRIADGLLWGNVASTATVVLHGIEEPGPLARARALVSTALEVDPLRHRLDGTVGGKITRRSCCLYYRTNDPRPCEDCPLTGATVTRLRRSG